MNYNSSSPSSITTSKSNLEFSPSELIHQNGSIQIFKSLDDTYTAVGSGESFQKPGPASVKEVIGTTNLDPYTALITSAFARNISIDVDHIKYPEQNSNMTEKPEILSDDPITKFYVCSIYVLGLYIFYRILTTQS